MVFDAPAPLTHCAERPRRAFAMLEFTGGTQTTDAAFDAAFGFAPGVLALLLPAVIWARIWHQRLADGGSSRIRALAPRRQPMRPGALPFLHRALVLLASLAMLPCTSAYNIETLDCYSAYYNFAHTWGSYAASCDWTLDHPSGCPSNNDNTDGHACCCSALRLDPASYAGVVVYVYSNNNCYKITVGTRIDQRSTTGNGYTLPTASDDQCRTNWDSIPLGNRYFLGSNPSTNVQKTQSFTGGEGTCNNGGGRA